MMDRTIKKQLVPVTLEAAIIYVNGTANPHTEDLHDQESRATRLGGNHPVHAPRKMELTT